MSYFYSSTKIDYKNFHNSPKCTEWTIAKVTIIKINSILEVQKIIATAKQANKKY